MVILVWWACAGPAERSEGAPVGVEEARTVEDLAVARFVTTSVSLAGDFDGDGDVDLAVSRGVVDAVDGTELLRAVGFIGAGDVDADGRLDFLSTRAGDCSWSESGRLDLWSGGVERTAWDPGCGGPHEVSAPGDLDGDGFGEIVTAGWADVYVLPGDAPPGPVETSAAWTLRDVRPDAVASGDLDGDGWIDLVASSTVRDAPILGFTALPRGELAAADADVVIEAPGYGGFEVGFVGDLDGDGYADLGVGDTLASVATREDGAVRVWRGPVIGARAAGSADATVFGDHPATRIGRPSAAGDADGDGAADWWVAAPEDEGERVDAESDRGVVYLLLGMPAGTSRITAVAAAAIPGLADGDRLGESLAAGADLDGDGIADLAVAGGGHAWVLLGGSAW